MEIYCARCGLYIQFPAEYGGGTGRCPRCKARLILPKTPVPGEGEFEEGMRFFAKQKASAALKVITFEDGPSVLFRCTNCENEYESLLFAQEFYNLCPLCKSPGLPEDRVIDFPRPSGKARDRKTPRQP
jgi:DNA-directed RNA polymerase subunit RPC12/RpoP